MNPRAANSGGSASPVPPPPPLEVFIFLGDGSCIPATRDKLKIVLKQARSAATKKRRLMAQEKADELQRNLEDRAIARRLLRELAEIDREHSRKPAVLRVKVKQEGLGGQTSDVRKRSQTPSPRSINMTLITASSWVIDDDGMRGVHYSQTYLSRKSEVFYRGAARDRWLYEARDEAVLRDRDGEPVIISNLGDDVDEIGAAWQAIEDAIMRANGKVQIRIIVALDADASTDEQIAALKHFGETVLAPLGLPYSAVIHRAPDTGDQRNVHGHILTNFRPTERVEPYTWAFADHVRGELDGKNGVQMLRHLWAHSMTEAAEKARRNMRYTGLGYGARGLDLEAGEHLSEAKSAMVARGQRVWAHERNKIKNARNQVRRAIRDADRKIEALTKLRDAVIAQMSDAAKNVSMPDVLVTAPTPHRAAKLTPSRSQPRRSPPILTPSKALVPAERLQAAAGHLSDARLIRAAMPSAAANAPLRASTSVANRPPRILEAAGIVVLPSTLHAASQTQSVPRRLVAATAASEVPLRLTAAGQTVGGTVAGGLTMSVSEPTASAGIPLKVAKWAKPPNILTPSMPVGTTPPNDMVVALLHALAEARRRRAARRLAARQRDMRMRDEPILTLADIPTREQFEAQPRVNLFAIAPADRLVTDPVADERRQADEKLIARIRKADVYIADTGDDGLSVHWIVTEKLGVDDAWIRQPHVQRAFADIREDQQQVIAALRVEADARPLDFSATSMRFWPADLDRSIKARVDRWATDEGFIRDASGVQDAIGEAHRADKLAKAGSAERSRPQQSGVEESARAGLNPAATTRQRARSASDNGLEGLRIRAFSQNSGRPTKSLLMLIRYVGERPDAIGGSSGDAMEANDSVPVAIRTLVDGWRRDDRVRSLVATTAKASRQAGRPVWPPEMESDIRATVATNPWPSWSSDEVGLSR